MSIINLIKTSVYSLKSHKLRVFLTMIGIIIGISSVITIMSVGNGLKVKMNESMADTSANKINVNFEPENKDVDLTLIESFSKSDPYYLKTVPGVEKAEVSKDVGGMGGFSSGDATYFDKKAYIMLEDYDGKEINVKYGRSFKKSENDKKLIILAYKAAEKLFKSPEKAIGCGITVNGVIYEVTGVLEKEGVFALTGEPSYISKESKENMNTDTTISSLDVYIKAGEDKDKVFENVKNELVKVHPNLKGEYKLQDPQAATKIFGQIIGYLTAFIALISGISLFVGGIGVMNIMYVSVTERKREIGIRRAIGAKPKSILLQFLIEAIMVTGLGGLLGILFGFIFCKIIGIFMPFPPVMSGASVIGATAISVIIGIIFGIIPAINASKMDPIKAIYN
ncbi:ABC transporter permease [Clostridium estertheticum]|uniref:ABC transporter permease n=1 Tax=Clostridium estertheticum TaxID=238834 RepID=UPI001C7D87EA|nr:ABC transporter permease [Clostridium estertheticum]MBX4266113.1 ABC transporter permease [Clostridium estertheticum]MBX4270318.1 ABC transporter permease [Clostridium estertheticum]WLC80859.1 ABC transporter permease [Clostridium estertheticum]WLC87921.1 ABC transporter permease [Clostridium estertheticum]